MRIDMTETASAVDFARPSPTLPTMTGDGVLTVGGKTYVTPARFATSIGVNVRTLQRWEAQRIGPPLVCIGRLRLIDMDAVPGWLEKHRTDEKPSPRRRARRGTR